MRNDMRNDTLGKTFMGIPLTERGPSQAGQLQPGYNDPRKVVELDGIEPTTSSLQSSTGGNAGDAATAETASECGGDQASALLPVPESPSRVHESYSRATTAAALDQARAELGAIIETLTERTRVLEAELVRRDRQLAEADAKLRGAQAHATDLRIHLAGAEAKAEEYEADASVILAMLRARGHAVTLLLDVPNVLYALLEEVACAQAERRWRDGLDTPSPKANDVDITPRTGLCLCGHPDVSHVGDSQACSECACEVYEDCAEDDDGAA